MKTLILIVAYEAENHIQSVLSRIPWSRLQGHGKVLVLDDASIDHTSTLASSWIPPNNAWPIQVLKNPVNLGYGGESKSWISLRDPKQLRSGRTSSWRWPICARISPRNDSATHIKTG